MTTVFSRINLILLVFLIANNSIGIAKTNSTSFSDKIHEYKINPSDPEVVFTEHNSPYDFVYADGVYDNGKAINKYEQTNYNRFDWESFSLDFDFYTSETREQWPLIMGTSTRSLGFLLKENRTIEITVNNQKQIYLTQGIYESNKWYHAKIIKNGSKTEIYLNDIKIGELQVFFDIDTKNYNQKCLSTINSSNGIAFDGLLRNIIYTKKGDLEFSKKMYEKYASKYSNENLILDIPENAFQRSYKYNLYSLNWKSFTIQFDYTHSNDETQLVLGSKWKVIDFHTINDTASISINNNRINFLSGLKLEPNQEYKVEIIINNNVLQMLIDNTIVLHTSFEYYNKNILEYEKEILVFSKKEMPPTLFKNLTIENNVPIKNIEKPILLATKHNKLIDTKNEGVIMTLFTPPFELSIKENNSENEFAFTKMITGFNASSFEMNFDFTTNKKGELDLVELGVYTKYAEIGLSINNNNLVFKTKNKTIIIPPINTTALKEDWNNCKIVSNNGLIKIYLNNIKTYEMKFRFSNQYYKSKLLMIRNNFIGSYRNLYIYESPK
ncbi:LamG-like jellyroll fold domain-containing protein [Flavobacterium ovatum]|uniref:LamG-like jellyroll fold domain-containing protein n=1 Tax=Flavobacterium ovatum TaxID=1928857 RepID=UPI00344E272F